MNQQPLWQPESFDFIWARRTRRAFRLIVTFFLLFTLSLWFSEEYLRYDHSETQYRMSLTLHPAQARPILRTVARRFEENNAPAPVRYLEALARVEESEHVLEMYAQAYKNNYRDASLIINYGVVLFMVGQFEEARELFREAGVNPPRNILPRYLEAAALAAGMESTDDISDLIALISRANAVGDPVLFPAPLWHDSLPKSGRRYQELRCEIARQLTFPLLRCTEIILERAQSDMVEGQFYDWDSWLENIAEMGEKLMGNNSKDSVPTIPQAIAALEIQKHTLHLRARLSEIVEGTVRPELNDSLLRVEEALKAIITFEKNHQLLLQNHHKKYFAPIRLICIALVMMSGMYIAAKILHSIGSGGRRARSVPHLFLGKMIISGGLFFLLMILFALAESHHRSSEFMLERFALSAWCGVLGIVMVFGLAYPFLLYQVMTTASDAKQSNEKEPLPPTAASYSYRRVLGAYGCLLQRYTGVFLGGLIVIICVWTLIYRIRYSVFPFQFELLPGGLELEADALLAEVRQFLKK